MFKMAEQSSNEKKNREYFRKTHVSFSHGLRNQTKHRRSESNASILPFLSTSLGLLSFFSSVFLTEVSRELLRFDLVGFTMLLQGTEFNFTVKHCVPKAIQTGIRTFGGRLMQL